MRGTWPSTLACASPCPDCYPLGREFSPAGADCGFREPLAPRLARPGAPIVAARRPRSALRFRVGANDHRVGPAPPTPEKDPLAPQANRILRPVHGRHAGRLRGRYTDQGTEALRDDPQHLPGRGHRPAHRLDDHRGLRAEEPDRVGHRRADQLPGPREAPRQGDQGHQARPHRPAGGRTVAQGPQGQPGPGHRRGLRLPQAAPEGDHGARPQVPRGHACSARPTWRARPPATATSG